MKKRSLHHRPCRTAVSLLLTCLLLFALLPTAIAAQEPTARLEQLSSEDDLLVFGLYLDDAIGLEAWNLQIGYDPAVLELRGNIPGKDAAAAANLKENYLTSENYEMETGKLLIGGYFVNALGAAANPGETVEIDAGHFELLRLTFRPVNAAAIDTPLTVRVTYTQGLRLQGESLQVRWHSAHTFGKWTVTKEPTCVDKGSETRTCTFCGETETREVDATGHSFGEWTVTKAATCVDQGTETRVCAVCKKTETREVDATGAHSFGEWKISREPTCADGVMVRLCGVCGATETKPIPAVSDHSFGAWTETKAATATEEGEETRSCTVCGETETRAIPKKPAVTADNIGDVDRDGKVTASDARLALRAAVGLETFDDETTDIADADRDEKITASDARLILRAAVGLEDRKNWLAA